MEPAQTRFWDLYSYSYDAIGFSIPYQKHLDRLLDALDPQEGEMLVDLGCATGNLERRLADRGGESMTLVGLDYSPKMIKRASRKCHGQDWMAFVQADLTEGLPFDSGSVDRAVANNSLYALSDREGLVAEVLRVLRPGGVFVVSDPKPETKVPEVIREHYREINSMPLPARVWNHAKTAATLPVVGLVPIALSKMFISRRELEGGYHFSSEDELGDLFAGFACVSVESVYADQSWLVVATKEA